MHEDKKRQQLVHVDRIKQYFLPKYDYESRSTMVGNQNDKNPKEKESAQTEKQKSVISRNRTLIGQKPEIDKKSKLPAEDGSKPMPAEPVKSTKPRRLYANQNFPARNAQQEIPTTKNYPGLKEDILRFTSSYFGNDDRNNAHYNLRRINRVNYNT